MFNHNSKKLSIMLIDANYNRLREVRI